jgi:3-hydroxyacyl-CoA dehydrogenase
MTVMFERHGDVALALIDRPPVNAIDVTVRAGLLAAVQQAVADPQVRALVVACRGRTFCSGADLEELNTGVEPPGYPEMLTALEDCPKPVIASMHGTALGGGLEIAMACHYRCATPGARMGMPEITLGILPGAGGTQRLPRLIGPVEALDMLIKGAPVDAVRARELELIDEIVGDDPVAGGLEFARRLLAAGTKPRPTRERTAKLRPLSEAEVQACFERHARSLKGRTTQHLVVKSIRAATEKPWGEGLRIEAQLSADSLRAPESRALRHVFFAERECARVPGIEPAARPWEIRRAMVVGAGTMGTGIAMSLAEAGIETWLVDREPAALERGLRIIDENHAASVQRGRMTTEVAQAQRQRILGTTGLDAAAGADLVIEAVFEDMQLKRTLLQRIDALLPDDALLASNTSSLSLTTLAQATRRPERVIGLHFFSPANVMRLLEIVRGAATSADTISRALTVAKKLRKIGVVVGDGFGFVGNRMMLDGYFREADLMLLQGVAPARIDAAMEAFGFAMGPNRVNDMAGIDVGTRVRNELLKREQRPATYHLVSDSLTAMGRLGQKSGLGIYRYEPGNRAALDDPAFAQIVQQLARQHGVEPRAVSDEEIQRRCVLSLVNIGADILAERLAYRAGDIDVIWTSGYGFPRWRGGPMHYADSLGLDRVVREIRAFWESGNGDHWRPAASLEALAREGKTFADWDRELVG